MTTTQTTTKDLGAEALFERYAGAFATHDTAQVVALHTEDSVFWQHTDAEPAVGREAIAATFAGLFEMFPNLRFQVQRTLFGDTFWVLDWKLVADLGPSGIAFDCTDLVTFDADGLVSRKDTWIDTAQLNKAMGSAA